MAGLLPLVAESSLPHQYPDLLQYYLKPVHLPESDIYLLLGFEIPVAVLLPLVVDSSWPRLYPRSSATAPALHRLIAGL
jgi:hypothetical protein